VNLNLGVNNDFGSSGPIPHSRWTSISQQPYDSFVLNETALRDPAAGSAVWVAPAGVIDDDNEGGVVTGGGFCLELSSAAALETWAGQLSPDPATGARRCGRRRFSTVRPRRTPSPSILRSSQGAAKVV
jgi:hypothetical protein